jgi:hypothetical protein
VPFTPFHMGIALAAKPVLSRRFSVLTFGVAQIATDLEPLAGMILDWDTLHGWSHTVPGAALIGAAVAATAHWYAAPLVGFVHRKLAENRLGWLVDGTVPSTLALWTGAFMGTLSHLVLDAVIHHDMHPFAPFTRVNPLIGVLEHDHLYAFCAITGAIGAAVWTYVRWCMRKANAGHGRTLQRDDR